MELDNYTKPIIQQLKEKYIFSQQDIQSIDILKSVSNISEKVSILDEYMNRGDIETIKSFPSEEKKITFDDYTYLLVQLKTESIIVCVWDSDELWDDPVITSFKKI